MFYNQDMNTTERPSALPAKETLMDKQALIAILERARRGTLTPTDVDALHALFQPYLTPALPPPEPEARSHRELRNPRVGSVATVEIDFVRDRYKSGELQVQASYRLPDGSVSTDESHRIRFTGQIAPMVRALWELGFDETSRALQNEPIVARLNVRCEALAAFWSKIVRTIAIIIGYELKVTVTGTAPLSAAPVRSVSPPLRKGHESR